MNLKEITNPLESNFCVWDVEVIHGPDEVKEGWSNPEDMGLASAVVYDYPTNRYYFFLHPNSLGRLINLLQTRTCVGFNSVQFDSRVIQRNNREVVWWEGLWITRKLSRPSNLYVLNSLAHIDLLVEYVDTVYRPKDTTNWSSYQEILDRPEIHDGTFTLDALCEATLGERKTGSGERAPKLYRDGRYDELLEYNLQDVRLTKHLFEHILEYEEVTNRKGERVKIQTGGLR